MLQILIAGKVMAYTIETQMSLNDITEGDRQIILLALAWLALDRPGWDYTLSEIAEKFRGKAMFDSFKESNADRVKPPIPINLASKKILEEMSVYGVKS